MRGRRRSSPGPPGGFRREERRYPAGGPRRRRSLTPDRFRRGASPPPFKRGRYGRDPEDFYPPRGHNPSYYNRPAPHSRDRVKEGPRTYKDFCRTLPDDVTPEEAQKEYQQYLAEYWGSEVRADYESKKNEDWMKRRFDPRGMQKALEERNEAAQKAATQFAEDLKAGLLDPKAESFNQGAEASADPEEAVGSEAEEDDDGKKAKGRKAEKPKAATASDVMWKPDRIKSDTDLSRSLIEKLDKEKGIKGNALIPVLEEAKAPEEAAKATGEAEKAPAEAKPDVKKAEGEEERTDPPVDGLEVKAGPAVVKEEVKTDAEQATDQDGGYEGSIGQLDLQLTYLWKVHSIDYYNGKEAADPGQAEAQAKAGRMLRGPRPEEGEQAPEAEEKRNLKIAEKRIDQTWKKRLATGDPFEEGIQKEKVERLLDNWVEDQVKKIADNKWGCKLSQKLFVGRDYVVKHVRLKHPEKVEDQRNRIVDDIYFENYKKFRDEEQKLMQAELAKMQQAMQMQQGGLPMPWEGAGPQGGPALDGGFPIAGPQMHHGPLAPQRHIVMPGMMPGPGQMLVLAPGAGPMGPFISVPIAEATGMGGPGMGPPHGPPMRGPGGRGGGRGFFPQPFDRPMPGSAPGPRGLREYYDLDNPSNNRAVLDYGDL